MIMRPHLPTLIAEEDGYALVATILLVMLAAVIVGSLTVTTKASLNLTQHYHDALSRRLAAISIANIIADVNTDPATKTSFINSIAEQFCSSDYGVKFVIRPHSSLIDLNAANTERLALALERLGLSSVEAENTASEMVSSRDPRAVASQSVEDPSLRKGAPFESIYELYNFPHTHVIDEMALHANFSVFGKRADAKGNDMGAPISLKELADSFDREVISIQIAIRREAMQSLFFNVFSDVREHNGVLRRQQLRSFSVDQPIGDDSGSIVNECPAYVG